MIRIKDGFKGERSIIIPKMIVDFMENDPFCRQLHITDIGFYPRARHHFIDRREPINQNVFIYCVDGKGWYRLNGVKHEIHPGQFFILPANTPHSYGSSAPEPWSIYWIHFKGEMATLIAEGMHVPHMIALSHESRIQQRHEMFEEIFFTLKAGYNIENLKYAHSILYHYFGSLLFIREFRQAGSASTKQESQIDVCQQAIHFMKERINRHITLQQLAEFTGYTPNHFATMFRKAIGHAPLSYFNLLKMQAAAQMLDSTEMKVNQIAGKLGYEDTGYFTRLFTKIMGTSPTSYRNIARG
ncbi:MAG: AraC family transcriptional regulator [Bacteroidales bacterium]|nr:AraC family transcriptional regulator [Bacteroidales bacterium]